MHIKQPNILLAIVGNTLLSIINHIFITIILVFGIGYQIAHNTNARDNEVITLTSFFVIGIWVLLSIVAIKKARNKINKTRENLMVASQGQGLYTFEKHNAVVLNPETNTLYFSNYNEEKSIPVKSIISASVNLQNDDEDHGPLHGTLMIDGNIMFTGVMLELNEIDTPNLLLQMPEHTAKKWLRALQQAINGELAPLSSYKELK